MKQQSANLEEVKELLSKAKVFGDKFDSPLGASEEWTLYPGDLSVKGNWRLPAENVIFRGNLSVGKNLLVTAPKSDHPSLVVIGNASCENLFMGYGGTMLVTGKLEARDLLYTAAQDTVTWIGDEINARVVRSGCGGGWITSFNPKKATIILLEDYIENGLTGGQARLKSKGYSASSLFADAVLDREDFDRLDDYEKEGLDEYPGELDFYIHLDHKKLLRALEKNRPVFR